MRTRKSGTTETKWRARRAGLGLAVLMTVSCATPAPPPELVRSRESYDLAAATPTIVEHAPVDLFEAGKLVERAEAAYKAEEDAAEVLHLSYLAIKRVEIAEAEARSHAAKQAVERLKTQRGRTRYEVRSRQADDATREAAQARAQVNSLVTAPQQRAAPGRSAFDELAAYEARLAQPERDLAAGSIERRLRELESRQAGSLDATGQLDASGLLLPGRARIEVSELQTQVASEQGALQLQAAHQLAAKRALELQAANQASAQRALELQTANAEAARRVLEAQTSTEAAEQRLQALADAYAAAEQRRQALEAANAAAEQEVRELRLAREVDAQLALATQATAPATTLAAKSPAPDRQLATVVPARRDFAEQAALEKEARKALERQEEAEASERRLVQQLAIEEAQARRAFGAAAAQGEAQRELGAARLGARETAEDAIRAESALAAAERRAKDLETENIRLKAANDTLLAAVGSAPPIAKTEAVTPPRDVVIVKDELQSADAARKPAARNEFEAALAAERGRADELVARQEETLASVTAERAEAQRAAERANERASKLERERAQLQEWNASLTEGGIVLTLQDLFASNRSEPQPSAQESLRRLATLLGERPGRRIVIEGHTDSAGGRAYNLELSRKRADAVRRFLELQGVAADRMEASGAGEDDPAAPNDTPEGRKKNRRVEVKILDAPPVAAVQEG